MKRVLIGLIYCHFSIAFGIDYPSTLNQNEYRKLYPLSVKFCAMTRVHRKGESPGGPFAHAVLYFDNACVDNTFGYPQIRRCKTGEAQGAGVSVNKIFKNVNWVALPSREVFFYGDIRDSQPIDGTTKKNCSGKDVMHSQAKEDLITKVAAMSIYQGIEVKDDVAKERATCEDETRFKINRSLDTDFAINWGRDIYCVNVPLNENLLDKGIEFINLSNIVHADTPRYNSYKLQHLKFRDLQGMHKFNEHPDHSDEGANEYNWSGVSENCAHLAYNLFAAMGLVAPRRVGGKIPNAVPADRWVSLIGKANDDFQRPIDEVWELYFDGRDRNTLLEQSVVVKHHGVVAEAIPGHNEANNDVFHRTKKLKALWPINWWPTYNLSVNRPYDVYDVRQNLLKFDEEYSRVLAELKGPVLEIHPDKFPLLQSKPNMERFIRTVELFKEAIRAAQTQAREKLAILDSGLIIPDARIVSPKVEVVVPNEQ